MKFIRALDRFRHRFVTDERGNVLILFVLAVLFLVGIGGAGIDLGRQQLLSLRLQNAADASSTSAAAMTNGGASITDKERIATAQRYFNLNFPLSSAAEVSPQVSAVITPASGTTSASLTVSAGCQGTATCGDAAALTTTNFVSNLGIKTLNSYGSSTVQVNPASTTPYDLILVMDNSGSMSFNDAGSGATTPVTSVSTVRNTAVGLCTSTYLTYYGPVFTQLQCNGFTNGYSDPNNYNINGWGIDSTPSMRLGALRNSANTILNQLLPSGNTTNRVAAVTWNETLLNWQPFSTTASPIAGLINSMFAFNGTDASVGLGKAQSIATTFDNTHAHVVVLLTDGTNTRHGGMNFSTGKDASGCDGQNPCALSISAAQTICTALKNMTQPTYIYTIAFGTDVTGSGSQAASAKSFLQNCASGNASSNLNQFYFEAPDSTTLIKVFQTIVSSVQSIRIIK